MDIELMYMVCDSSPNTFKLNHIFETKCIRQIHSMCDFRKNVHFRIK